MQILNQFFPKKIHYIVVYVCQVFINLQDHLHFFLHFVFSFMGQLFMDDPISVPFHRAILSCVISVPIPRRILNPFLLLSFLAHILFFCSLLFCLFFYLMIPYSFRHTFFSLLYIRSQDTLSPSHILFTSASQYSSLYLQILSLDDFIMSVSSPTF